MRKITFSEWSQHARAQRPVRICFWWPSSFLLEDVLRSKLQALPLTVTRVVWARWAHLHLNWFRNTTVGKMPFIDRSLFKFPSHVVWHNTTHAGIMLYHMADWKISGAPGTGRSEVNRTRVFDLQPQYRWYGSIPHCASGLLIGPHHINQHVTCGKIWYSCKSFPPRIRVTLMRDQISLAYPNRKESKDRKEITRWIVKMKDGESQTPALATRISSSFRLRKRGLEIKTIDFGLEMNPPPPPSPPLGVLEERNV